MKLDEIIKQASNSILEDKTKESIDKKTLEIIEKCVNNNIRFNISENELTEIEQIYYRINKRIDFAFLKRVADNSINKIDFDKFLKYIEK